MAPKAATVNTTGSPAASVKIPELLAPAGSFEKMATAIHYGADAVYCGGRKYSLRAHAGNFTEHELEKAVAYAHARDVKLYVTVNIFAHQEDLVGLEKYLVRLQEGGVDGIIVSDPGIFMLAQKTVPGMPVHLSTQANVTNPAGARFWEQQGAARLNLARELSLVEIATIRKSLHPGTQVEVFVHGALCISYSGRCLLSCYLTGRDANRGDCAHPCRYSYALVEEKRPGQYFPVEEDEHGTYVFNAKDLCLVNKLPQLVTANVDSLKIEGRMKSVYYVGAVVRVYRAALDYIENHSANAREKNESLTLPPIYKDELLKVGTRGYTENFISGVPGPEDMLYDSPRLDQEYIPVGVVRGMGQNMQEGWPAVEIRNPLRQGDRVEYLGRNIETESFVIEAILDQDGIPLKQANPGDIVTIRCERGTEINWEVNALLRKSK